ncbi:WLM domain-containing protein [Cokeromyces recurvatus]|uniref:WLM domain-containing protein n=1 Tax=Cokeromyces recurvatus TaxID=90255 RepID=UPI0022201DBF|nr:WLM domain-containing protein [Cokeromyces recurvatus]KAI7903696.1 WLM domain-containing protein [Cokeromyces recurvatus]
MNTDLVKDYKILKSKPRSEEALQLLKRLASQIKPILSKHQWKITNLCEFFPRNPNLLGTNVNRGWKINLRLRSHYDDSKFLEYEDLLGTLLHEITHIVIGPHDARFYKLLDELKQETEALMVSGYTGEGFFSKGQKLGNTSNVPRYLSNQMAASAADRRLQLSKIMTQGGVRLGGGNSQLINNMTAAQLAGFAAQKRLQDKIWCGSSSSSSDDNDDEKQEETRKRKSLVQHSPKNKKSRTSAETNKEIIDLTSDDEGWTCFRCTFLNMSTHLVCQVCLSEKKTITKNDVWSCPKCTLINEMKWQTCIACSYVYLR